MSKKQASISLSTTEAEYIVTGSCCTQLLWMKTLLGDILTKPLDGSRFESLRKAIGVCAMS
jgi:hypothetical protein